MRIGTLLARCAAALLLTVGDAAAQQERLTVDWIFGEEGESALSVPQHAWLADHRILLYDSRVPVNRRTLEIYDVRRERRISAADPQQILEKLNALLDTGDPVEELGWPDAIASSGRYVAYEHEEDIFALDLEEAVVFAIAASDAIEKSARFSPDGRKVAFIRANDLYVLDLESRDETRLTTGASESLMNGTVSWVYWEELLNRVDQGYFWAPDSSAIAYLQTDDSGVGEMHYVDFKPNLPRLIKQRHPKPGEMNPRVRAGVVTLDDASTTWIDLGANLYEYIARIKWLPDSQRLAVQTLDRPQTTLDLFIANARSGKVEHLIRETDPGWVNVHDDLYFLQDREQFIWRSERSGFSHLYLIGLDGEVINPVTSGDWALRPSGGVAGMDRAVSAIDAASGHVWFTALEKASTERHLYRADLDGSGFRRISEGDGTHAILFHPDGSYYLDRYANLAQPPALTLHRNDGETLATISSAVQDVKKRFDLQEWEKLIVPARDGFAMPALMLKPRFFDPDNEYPAVVYVYGGPSAPTAVDNWLGQRGLYHQLLADHGIVVFYVDNRSAAGKSKIDANTITGQLYGPVELNDLLDGVRWLKAQPFIDAERVGIWGRSGGGAMTLQAMTSSQEFSAGVSVAPVTDWHYYDTLYTERYLKRPQDNAEGYAATSNVRRAGNLHGRLLLVHGTYDDNVHPQNSWAFSDALVEAGILFDMLIYPMRKHSIGDEAAQKHLHRAMVEFWQRNLSAGDAP